MCFQHLDNSAHVPALHSPITVSIHHHLKLTPGEGTQHVCLYLCPNCSTLRGSDTHRIVVSSSLLWVQQWWKVLLKSLWAVNPVHLECFRVIMYAIHLLRASTGQRHGIHWQENPRRNCRDSTCMQSWSSFPFFGFFHRARRMRKAI